MPILASLLLTGLPFYAEVQHATPPLDRGSAAVVTEALRGSQPFRELLPSWNVEAPVGTAFVVELRVDAVGEGAWSPWMHVGDWGERKLLPALLDRVVTCPGGRVDVDVFRGERTFAAAELRVRAFGRAEGPPVQVKRISACFSDRERAVAPLEPLERRPLGVVLDVPLRSQKSERAEIASRICSPTSVAMLLNFRGVNVPTIDVAARAYDAAHEIYGVWPRNVQTAYSYGVPGYVARFSDWGAVERAIAAGTPIVASIGVKKGQLAGAPYETTAGHLIVIVGFDAEGNCIVNDPASPALLLERRTYARRDMETVWMERGGTAYVLEARR
jgi:uncharacterized protein YvpB